MSRPTITLAVIAKNEEKNVRRFLESFQGAVDEIIFCDTGSTDKTVEIATEMGCKVVHFKWINDFAAARNFAFSHATSDYVMWSDLDDVLHNKEGFIQWRDHAMEFAECWMNTYNYALDAQGKPIVSFVRERVFKRSINPQWEYPLHEGINIKPEWSKDYAIGWSINHLRDAEDVKADKSRNITILDTLDSEGKLDSRLTFYYGKELFEAQQPAKALTIFARALNMDLQPHDRVLALQYGCYAAMMMADQLKDEFHQEKEGYFTQALKFAHQGMQLDPNRAEFHVACGDIHLKRGDLLKAIPYYNAAKKCFNPRSEGSPYEGAIYSFVDCYGENPTLQLAKIYFHMGKLKEARREALEGAIRYGSEEAGKILKELNHVTNMTRLDNKQQETDDIVFTTPPVTAYPFDEMENKTKGYGGSETALIEMARELKKLMPHRKVIVYNMRETDLIAESGVEYRSNRTLTDYLGKYKPAVHIAWRHNIKLTNAPTYAWCHDLMMPTAERIQNFDELMVLTPFHKNYVMAKQGIPESKIWVTRNGLTTQKFPKYSDRKPKDPNKIVWMSSPDRGLDRAMLVMDEVRKEFPEAKLHVYYGLDNLYKYGMASLADKLKAMMDERPWVIYHGMTEQSKMFLDVSDAVVWCHPCNFIETFCLTALEMLELKIFPVTRKLGALQDTLKEAEDSGDAVLLDSDCITKEQINEYAWEVKKALWGKKWEDINFDLQKHTWESVAKEWKEHMKL